MDYDYVVGSAEPPSGWFYLAIIYEGKGNGFKVYYDGVLKSADTQGRPTSYKTQTSGRMVIGRRSTAHNGRNAEVMVDELALWNN